MVSVWRDLWYFVYFLVLRKKGREREREHELGWGEGDFLKGVDIGKRIW